MVSMIKEINDNLKAIIDNLKNNLDTSTNTLENIQVQMDKKVEEAKKYKIQVDTAKDKIKSLEEDNKNLEASLKELSDKYSKMNLVSLVEAGNREIKTKINDNLREISKQKEHIADLTNKARTIKDLLISLKKDKTSKEAKLENLRSVYEYYNDRVNDIVDYANNHSENLSDYVNVKYNEPIEDEFVESTESDIDLDNTMIFDEIANIDENRNFKDEMTFINDQIDGLDVIADENSQDDSNIDEDETIISEDMFDETEDEQFDEETGSTFEKVSEPVLEDKELEVTDETDAFNLDDFKIDDTESKEETILNEDKVEEKIENEPEVEEVVSNEPDLSILNIDTTLNSTPEENEVDENTLDKENEDRINKINSLFSSVNDNVDSVPTIDTNVSGVEDKIDNAFQDVFGTPVNEPIKKDSTLTDIFGNPINSNEINKDISGIKKLEETFVKNGIDFNKFSENEQTYLKDIFNETNFVNIINTLNRNQINLDNVYNAYNIFGEISANELESIITKLVDCGQSVEAIGLILEKLPKIKDYNLDEAIMSYGDYIKNIDITELVMKAKELSEMEVMHNGIFV